MIGFRTVLASAALVAAFTSGAYTKDEETEFEKHIKVIEEAAKKLESDKQKEVMDHLSGARESFKAGEKEHAHHLREAAKKAGIEEKLLEYIEKHLGKEKR